MTRTDELQTGVDFNSTEMEGTSPAYRQVSFIFRKIMNRKIWRRNIEPEKFPLLFHLVGTIFRSEHSRSHYKVFMLSPLTESLEI